MIVKDLIEKLMSCPQDAVVLFDSNGVDEFCGNEVAVEKASKDEVISSIEDADDMDLEFLPDNMTHIVRIH